MKERMQKTLSQVNGCPQRDRSETEWYGGVQTFMWMCEDNIVEVPFGKEHLFEQILSPSNLNRTIKTAEWSVLYTNISSKWCNEQRLV